MTKPPRSQKEHLHAIDAAADEDEEVSLERGDLEASPHERGEPVVAAPKIDGLRGEVDPRARRDAQARLRRVDRDDAARRQQRQQRGDVDTLDTVACPRDASRTSARVASTSTTARAGLGM